MKKRREKRKKQKQKATENKQNKQQKQKTKLLNDIAAIDFVTYLKKGLLFSPFL